MSLDYVRTKNGHKVKLFDIENYTIYSYNYMGGSTTFSYLNWVTSEGIRSIGEYGATFCRMGGMVTLSLSNCPSFSVSTNATISTTIVNHKYCPQTRIFLPIIVQITDKIEEIPTTEPEEMQTTESIEEIPTTEPEEMQTTESIEEIPTTEQEEEITTTEPIEEITTTEPIEEITTTIEELTATTIQTGTLVIVPADDYLSFTLHITYNYDASIQTGSLYPNPALHGFTTGLCSFGCTSACYKGVPYSP